MAHSTTKERALQEIEPFWERSTLEHPLRWERWRIILKLVTLATEGILIDTLPEEPPDKVTLPLDSIYEEDVDNSTTQSERDRGIRNEQLKNSWINKC